MYLQNQKYCRREHGTAAKMCRASSIVVPERSGQSEAPCDVEDEMSMGFSFVLCRELQCSTIFFSIMYCFEAGSHLRWSTVRLKGREGTGIVGSTSSCSVICLALNPPKNCWLGGTSRKSMQRRRKGASSPVITPSIAWRVPNICSKGLPLQKMHLASLHLGCSCRHPWSLVPCRIRKSHRGGGANQIGVLTWPFSVLFGLAPLSETSFHRRALHPPNSCLLLAGCLCTLTLLWLCGTSMTITTLHLLHNIVQTDNCGFQTQGCFDCEFNWCNKDFAFKLICFRMNSMGAHFNPMPISIVNSESKIVLKQLLR